MNTTKVTLRLDNNNGTYMEVVSIMPSQIAETFSCHLVDWENRWDGSFSDVRDFYESKSINKHEKETTNKA